MDLDCLLASQRSREDQWSHWWRMPSLIWLEILLEDIFLCLEWMKLFVRSLLMIISYLYLGIEIYRLQVWRETGLKEEESFIMMKKLSLSGSMKKINWESFPCRKEVMSRLSLKDFLEELVLSRSQSWKSLEEISCLILNMVTFILAQPTLELEWELLVMLIFLDGPRLDCMPSTIDVKNFIFSQEEQEENLEGRLVTLMTFPTSIDLGILKFN